MLYRFQNSEPRWINFENPKGEKGRGGVENNGAKGHAWEHLDVDERKVLCDFEGCGVIRRIWITLNDRSPEVLQNVFLEMYWDGAEKPQVNVPIGDFFCMGLGEMRAFENRFFSTAEGRSFCCAVPMPFFNRAVIVLNNRSGRFINNLFYDIDLSLEKLCDEDMLFCAYFHDGVNSIEENVEILPLTTGKGRFLGANIAVFPDEEKYPDIWWGEGEVKIYLDGDKIYPTLAGTGAEDYVGSAWAIGEFVNSSQGCVAKKGNAVSMYRFHADDPIYFSESISVQLQAMGGGPWEKVKAAVQNGAECSLVTYDDGELHHIYKKASENEPAGYVNFFRKDRYRTVAYYYKK